MTDDRIKDYTLKISQGSRTDIIVILYDMATDYLEDAVKAFENNDHAGVVAECTNAQRVLGDLIGALDFSYEISLPLFRIYQFISKEVSSAVITDDCEKLKAPIRWLSSLRESFAKVALEDNSGPMMGNAQTVYTGLTYGKSSLNESTDMGRGNRGFTV